MKEIEDIGFYGGARTVPADEYMRSNAGYRLMSGSVGRQDSARPVRSRKRPYMHQVMVDWWADQYARDRSDITRYDRDGCVIPDGRPYVPSPRPQLSPDELEVLRNEAEARQAAQRLPDQRQATGPVQWVTTTQWFGGISRKQRMELLNSGFNVRVYDPETFDIVDPAA